MRGAPPFGRRPGDRPGRAGAADLVLAWVPAARAASTRLAAACCAVTLLLIASPDPADAAHGGAVEGVVVDFTGLEAVREDGQPEGCAVRGVVHNAAARAVTVRIRYRARDSTGRVALAFARLARVEPGESRDFASSRFVTDAGNEGLACRALAQVEVVEAVADSMP